MNMSNRDFGGTNLMDTTSDPSEQAIPLAERVLRVEGQFRRDFIEQRVHQRMPAVLEQRKNQLTGRWHEAIEAYRNLHWRATFVYCAISFSYAQLPVGTTFERVFPYEQPHHAIHTVAVLVAVIHETLPIPLPFVDGGHRAICLFDFPTGVPALIRHLPDVTGFMQTPLHQTVGVSSETIWNYLIQRRTTP
jgi:hypothetical protein